MQCGIGESKLDSKRRKIYEGGEYLKNIKRRKKMSVDVEWLRTLSYYSL